jgi:hypothetical protein
VRKEAKSGDRKLDRRIALFESALKAVSEGTPVYARISDLSERAELDELHLLSAKSVLYVANVDEESLQRENPQVEALKEYAVVQRAGFVQICGKIEAEIAELPEDDQADFLKSLGLEQPGLHVLANSIYRLLGLQTFFTATEKESRAWTIPSGTTAVHAAGKIHTDMERGFICAEVFTIEELEKYGSEHALRAAGKIRQEGRDYVLRDGDVVFFRFNV